MQKILAWIKENRLSAVLIAVVVFLLVGGYDTPIAYDSMLSSKGRPSIGMMESESMIADFAPSPSRAGTPRLDIVDRKVSVNSNMSLVVRDVREAITNITNYAKGNGGYMVNSSSTAPEGLSNGNITIRVPSDVLDATLEYLRDASIKVVSESVTGRDITDQYMDVEARLATLNSTKARYEAILDRATDVDEILNVTQQILYIQDQIDSLTGQLQYLDASANSSLVTIYLSTDEFELPYSPDQPWRPEIVFKYAVRSVVQTLRDIADLTIWVGVYAVFWIPALVIFFLIKKRVRPPTKK